MEVQQGGDGDLDMWLRPVYTRIESVLCKNLLLGKGTETKVPVEQCLVGNKQVAFPCNVTGRIVLLGG